MTFTWLGKMKVHFLKSGNEKKVKQAQQNINSYTKVGVYAAVHSPIPPFSTEYFHSKKLNSV